MSRMAGVTSSIPCPAPISRGPQRADRSLPRRPQLGSPDNHLKARGSLSILGGMACSRWRSVAWGDDRQTPSSATLAFTWPCSHGIRWVCGQWELWAPTEQGRGPEQRAALPNPAPRQLGELAPGAVFLAACCWELTGAHRDTLLWGHTGSFSDAWDLRDQLSSDTALLGVLPQVLQDRACLGLEGEPPEPAPAQGHRGLWTRAPGHVCAHAS